MSKSSFKTQIEWSQECEKLKEQLHWLRKQYEMLLHKYLAIMSDKPGGNDESNEVQEVQKGNDDKQV